MSFIKKVLLIMLLISSQSVFAYEDYSDAAINRLVLIENSIFGRAGTEYDLETRLGNAERKVFGAVQSGDFNSRINLLSNVLESSNIYYNNGFNVYKSKSNTPLKIIRNALIQRQGVLTGFTPSPYPLNTKKHSYYYRNHKHKNIPPHRRNIYGGIK